METHVDPSFERIAGHKRDRIVTAALEEFATSGFAAASTNRIVENAGISKGSLFKYFGSKEELYLYIANEVLLRVMPIIHREIADMPTDVAERVRRLAVAVVNIYIDNPIYYRFFMGILDAGASAVQYELIRRSAGLLSAMDLFSGVDTSRFRFDEETTFLLIKWLFVGIKQELFEIDAVIQDPHELKTRFATRLERVIEALQKGIYTS